MAQITNIIYPTRTPVNDKCDKGVCVGTAKVDKCKGKPKCKAKGQCFVAGQCNKGTGLCSNPPKKKGTKCNDGNAKTGCVTDWYRRKCTFFRITNIQRQHHSRLSYITSDCEPAVEDQCDGKGLCKGIDKCANVGCEALSTCHIKGVCDKNTGKCSNPRKKAGTPCDDKDYKTGLHFRSTGHHPSS